MNSENNNSRWNSDQEGKFTLLNDKVRLARAVMLILLMFPLVVNAAVLRGYVYEKDSEGKDEPLPGVNIFWAGTNKVTTTDAQGRFTIERIDKTDKLVVSYVGYERDTITVNTVDNFIRIELKRNIQLKTMVVTARQSSTFIERRDPIVTQHISGTELHKAACCNLGESFETNASVDVSYGDAISGARRLELLGLTGIYSQLMIENIPDYEGFGRTFGLNYIPGHWLESISVSKGAASVLSGNESITGQISADYKKPDGDEIFYLNLYANDHGHLEMNSNASWRMTPTFSTMLLVHGGYNDLRLDINGNGFMDNPLTQQFHILNRWKYYSKDESLMIQWGVNLLNEERLGGQMDYTGEENRDDTSDLYGFLVSTKRYGTFLKGGYTFSGRAATNIAFLGNYSIHDQSSVFGYNNHDVIQQTFNQRVVFGTYLGNTSHIIQTGLSYQYHNFDEIFNDSLMPLKESKPGAFLQYTRTHLEKFTLMAGMRADMHNLYGFQWTPRLHFRYQPLHHTTLRVSAGKGYRTMHMFAENLFLLANSRNILFVEEPGQEAAWNYGIHLTQDLTILGRPALFNAEFFRTDFTNQVIIDMDRGFENIYIYNLDGSSYANNFQVDLTFEPISRLDVLIAMRFTDAKSTINEELLPVAFTKRYRGLATFSYQTRLRRWQFDLTAQFNGPSRLPENRDLPEKYQREKESPAYVIFNAQIARYFKKWNIYLGSENFTNFAQKNPIIAPDDPFGNYFDASQIWGPISGRKIYIGMRYIINR